jgi:hypothetical protein
MPHNLFFHLALTFILLHEMDAVRCKEWQIFPGLSLLNDFWGYRIFMLAHIPLFYFLFWQLAQPNNESFIKGLDIFFIIHVGLHLLFLMHKKNEFKDWMSWIIISGAGMFGLLDLVL